MKRNVPSIGASTNYVNLERLTFLVDGVFAITMTLLVLELRLPESGNANLSQSLLAMLPRLYIYFIAFYSIANHWLVDLDPSQLCECVSNLRLMDPLARSGCRLSKPPTASITIENLE